MKITALKAQLKNPERVSVFVDGKFSFGLSLSQIVELGVKNGQELEEHEVNQLKKQSDLGKAHMRSVEWLLRRPRSRRELADYMRRKNYGPDEQVYITEKVERYLDDEAFAHFWVESRRGTKNKSARSIASELAGKGVPREVVQKVLEDHEIKDDEAIKKVIEKKQRQTKYQDEQKLKEYLLRQGFSYDDIKKALSNED